MLIEDTLAGSRECRRTRVYRHFTDMWPRHGLIINPSLPLHWLLHQQIYVEMYSRQDSLFHRPGKSPKIYANSIFFPPKSAKTLIGIENIPFIWFIFVANFPQSLIFFANTVGVFCHIFQVCSFITNLSWFSWFTSAVNALYVAWPSMICLFIV